MKKAEIIEFIKENIKNRSEICIKRKRIDKNELYCIPLVIGQDYVLIQYLYDFQIDGYIIIRIKDITSVKSDESQKFTNMILKEEGIFLKIKEPPTIVLDKWESIFVKLNTLHINIIVECESIEKGNFYIGKIVDVNRNSLSLLHFNGVGEWDKEATNIYYKDITSVKFEDRYSTIISKYVGM